MTILDTYILRRFLFNFVVLLLLVFVLGAAIDVVVQLDEFTSAARAMGGGGERALLTVWAVVSLAVDFHAPRLFQFYAYLLGLTSVGAMAFTFAQMHRAREFTAIMASGVSLYRVAWPVLVAAFGLNVVHLFNANMILPRLAPLLLRSHEHLGRQGLSAFEVPLVRDGQGSLFHAALYEPESETIDYLTVIIRDDTGKSVSHITADRAEWSASRGGWMLTNGQEIRLAEEGAAVDARMLQRPVDFHRSDLSPAVLTVLRYDAFAQMLSLGQIQEMLDSTIPVDTAALARIKFGRFSIFFSNLLLLALSMQFFLLREPTNLLRQSVRCAAVTLPIAILTFILMEVEIPGIPAGASVFVPALVLLPLTMASLSLVRT